MDARKLCETVREFGCAPGYAMAQKIGDWIDQRQPGGYIHGPSRYGKSRGVKWHMKAVDRFRGSAYLLGPLGYNITSIPI